MKKFEDQDSSTAHFCQSTGGNVTLSKLFYLTCGIYIHILQNSSERVILLPFRWKIKQ